MPGEDMLAALEDDASTPPPTSAARLYRHALESVFAFCSLLELVPLLCVSKEWATAVNSMGPLGATLPDFLAEARVLFWMSSLPRHVDIAFLRQFPLSPSLLYNLTLRMTNLRELACKFQGSWSPLMFPVRLRKLTVRFQAGANVAVPFSDRHHRDWTALSWPWPHCHCLKSC
jgi:hypothetical protein